MLDSVMSSCAMTGSSWEVAFLRTYCPFWNGAARLRAAQNNGRRDQQRRARTGVPCVERPSACADPRVMAGDILGA
jgi:hypothetical protein